jgi:hypothetical protein
MPKNQSILRTYVFEKKYNPDDFIRILFYLMKNGPSTDVQIVKSLGLRKDRVGKIKEEFLEKKLVIYDKESKGVNIENIEKLFGKKATDEQKELMKKNTRKYSKEPYGISLLGVLLLADEKGFNSKYIFEKKTFNRIFNARFTEQEITAVQSIFVHKEFSKVLQFCVRKLIENVGKDIKKTNFNIVDFQGSSLEQMTLKLNFVLNSQQNTILQSIFTEYGDIDNEFTKNVNNAISWKDFGKVIDIIDYKVKRRLKLKLVEILTQQCEDFKNKISKEIRGLEARETAIKLIKFDLEEGEKKELNN